jgi:TldD protein
VRLAPVPAYDVFWETPTTVNPWDVPLEDKLALLVDTTTTMQKTKGVLFATALVSFNYEWKYLATSEGSFIEQVFFYTTCGCNATATHQGQVKTRSYQPGSMTRGYEFVTESDLRGQAERVAAEAVEFAMAKPVGAGLKDLVLLPSHLSLTIHEIIAHPTELDRVVG